MDPGVVIVTGGAGGIGRATVLMSARKGARAVALDVDVDVLAALEVDAATDDLNVLTRVVDVTDPIAVDAPFSDVDDTGGPIGGGVCSAGVSVGVAVPRALR